jgi:N-acetylmuramoyl-L-alanine amidase
VIPKLAVLSPPYPAPGYMTPRDVKDITDLVIHHTGGPVTQTVEQIDAEHRAIGDAMIAYNWVIVPDGTVYVGRPAGFVPAAAYGRNTESLNVCLVGNFEKGDPGFTGPPANVQVESLIQLAIMIHQRFPHIVRTIGHNQVAGLFYGGSDYYATKCPGSLLAAQLNHIRKEISTFLLKK